MRVSRVRIEALRQFREPVEIDSLVDGINLFVGPNGAGKSTIVRAIRAAFFERYGSGSVTDLLPWGDPGAGPVVEVDFASGGHQYRLRKQFMARRRCSLGVDGVVLENAEAESRLAELLGFLYAGKGASKPEHWGVPGLLWIQQGCGQELRDAVGHAANHLRKALDESLGEVASSGGDDVFEQVQAVREKLLTRTGQPTGELKAAASLLAAASDQVAALDVQLAAYRSQADRFGLLSRQILQANREQPWRRLEEQARAAREQCARVDKLREALDADRQFLAQTEAQIRLLEQQQASFTQQADSLEQRRLAAERAAARLVDAERELVPWRRQLEAAQQAHEQAQAAFAAIEAEEGRCRLLERINDLRKQLARLDDAAAHAQQIAIRLNGHHQEIAARRIGDAQVQNLRRFERDIQAAQIRLESVATSLSYRLEPGQSIERDGATLEGAGEAQLLGRTVLTIAQVGTLVIEPGGGHDLAKLGARRRDLEAAQAALLQSLGLDGLAAAERRLQQRQAAEQDAQVEQALLDQLVPKGLEALAAERAAVAGELAAASARLECLAPVLVPSAPPGGDGPARHGPILPPMTVAQARRVQADADRRLRQAQASEQEARDALVAASGAAVHATGEWSMLQAAVCSNDHQRRVAQNREELHATRLRFGSVAARVEDARRRIDAAQPLVIQQDAERLASSASRALQAHDDQRMEHTGLQAQLDAAGASGLEEQLADARGRLERAQRRHRELARRARALDLLTGMLRQKRQALTRRLQAPLLRHLNHYLHLLLPGARVDIDDELRPVSLTLAPGSLAGMEGLAGLPGLADPAGGGAGDAPGHGRFDDLSYGTREQIGMISRLAYADLLKEANRPTLIILDDCLVNTDAARLSRMKRVLYDAATRHQILLFSCHPERWQDLGTAPRDVLSLGSTRRPAGAPARDAAPESTLELDAS